MLKDKTGSLTLESTIIIPTIIILVVVFVLILIFSFQYNLMVVKTHHSVMTSQKLASPSLNFEINGKAYDMAYNFETNFLSMEKFQRLLSFFIDTLDLYYKRFIYE